MWTRSAAAVVLASGLIVTAAARADARPRPQQPPPRPSTSAVPVPQESGAAPPAEISTPGVSIDRIRRLLRETPPSKLDWTSSVLKLEYTVEVRAKAPPISIFNDFKMGPATAVQYGGMTHAEFLKITAPPWRPW
jgi:hypothetical protein